MTNQVLEWTIFHLQNISLFREVEWTLPSVQVIKYLGM